MSNHGFTSVPAIKQYLQYAEECGIDADPLLRDVGIEPGDLNDNSRRIPGSTMENLLERLAGASADPCFGLHASQRVTPASYSVLGYVCMNCSTLKEVIAKIPVYEKIVGDMGTTSITQDGDSIIQSWNCVFSNPVARRHEVECVLGSWIVFTRNFLHFKGFADAIWFEHSAPADEALLQDYQNIFDCPVLFEQNVSGIRFHQSLMDRSIPQADDGLLQTLLDHATAQLAQIDARQSVTEQVKNLLRLTLRDSVPSSALIAEKLGMSSRTLQRKLGEEQTHYKDVLAELRLELARYYLRNTDLSLDDIAAELGYAEARSFHRSFKQWTGQTAGAYRAAP